MRHGMAVSVMVLAVGAALVGCTPEGREQVFGEVAAEGLRVAAEDAFASAGFPIEGQLDCEVGEETAGEITANCSGTTEQGADVAFDGSFNTGDRDFTDGVEGSFRGEVNGAEVFSTDCLGC